MHTKDFCKTAVENGFVRSDTCVGWDWIRENLHKLDHIFDTPEYRAMDGYKYKCMPLLVGAETLSEIETDILGTAWYLNNDREHKRKRQELRQKMLAEDWLLLNDKVFKAAVESKKKIKLCGKVSGDWLSRNIQEIYRPIFDCKGQAFLVAAGKRRKGYFLNTLLNCDETDCFCKLISKSKNR